TASSQEEAGAIAHALVSRKLAACVSIMPIQSVYSWQGDIQTDQEWQLLIKTTLDCWQALETAINELHSYEVPELIALPIVQGSSAYLNWLGDMTVS
ncbi:MAG: divalent-cation tolerance protein CutA, partial [Merismopedia sp. SIO2A8]|nr:divalent-cation tolerance protein CutA [Merismopedia sp. SIO2A8]